MREWSKTEIMGNGGYGKTDVGGGNRRGTDDVKSGEIKRTR